MKKTYQNKLTFGIRIITALIILFMSYSYSGSQTVFDNSGGSIKNNGTFIVRTGHVKSMPDSIDGRVEFAAPLEIMTQLVPTIKYNQLVIRGKGQKVVDSVYNSLGQKVPLVTRDSLIVIDSTKFYNDEEDISAQGTVKNEAMIWGRKDVKLQGTAAQNIHGDGRYTNLNLDNPDGADVIEGGFRINRKLELTRGQFRNSASNNFFMEDSTLIIRHVGSELASAPVFRDKVSVKYTGSGEVNSGPEIPSSQGDTTRLLMLAVDDGGIQLNLTDSVFVNDSLYVGGVIYTDSINDYLLTYNGAKNPEFSANNPNAEIIGKFRRTNLSFDGTINVFNNPYMYAIFADQTAAGDVKELTFHIKPRTIPPFLNGEKKIRRFIQISANDANHQPVSTVNDMILGYGWRHDPADPALDETGDEKVFEELILQRWNQTEQTWHDYADESTEPTDVPLSKWAYARALRINDFGYFAIGMPNDGVNLALNARVFLEGPYRNGSMAADLRSRDLIPSTPPDIYPYNKDPNRSIIFVDEIPQDIVDWIVVEFRHNVMDSVIRYRTCFLRKDGKLVDFDGISDVNLRRGDIDSGEYHLAILHRNHLSIITEDPIRFNNSTNGELVDFTEPTTVLGRTGALKELEDLSSGQITFGMLAGESYESRPASFGMIDDLDLFENWEHRDEEGYFIYDYNMSGFVNTRDFNYSWNNRGKQTLVP